MSFIFQQFLLLFIWFIKNLYEVFCEFLFFCVNERMMHIVVETLRKRKFNALVRWNVMLLLIHKKHLIPLPLQGIYFHIYYIYLCISVMYPSNMRMQTFIKSHVDI